MPDVLVWWLKVTRGSFESCPTSNQSRPERNKNWNFSNKSRFWLHFVRKNHSKNSVDSESRLRKNVIQILGVIESAAITIKLSVIIDCQSKVKMVINTGWVQKILKNKCSEFSSEFFWPIFRRERLYQCVQTWCEVCGACALK